MIRLLIAFLPDADVETLMFFPQFPVNRILSPRLNYLRLCIPRGPRRRISFDMRPLTPLGSSGHPSIHFVRYKKIRSMWRCTRQTLPQNKLEEDIDGVRPAQNPLWSCATRFK